MATSRVVSTQITASPVSGLLDLPFVCWVGKKKSRRVCYWNPVRTGRLSEDYAIGQLYGVKCLQCLQDYPDCDLLFNISLEMPDDIGPLEFAFWRTVTDRLRTSTSEGQDHG